MSIDIKAVREALALLNREFVNGELTTSYSSQEEAMACLLEESEKMADELEQSEAIEAERRERLKSLKENRDDDYWHDLDQLESIAVDAERYMRKTIELEDELLKAQLEVTETKALLEQFLPDCPPDNAMQVELEDAAREDELEQLRAENAELIEIATKARRELGADTTPKMDGSHIGIASEAMASARRTLKRAIGLKYCGVMSEGGNDDGKE